MRIAYRQAYGFLMSEHNGSDVTKWTDEHLIPRFGRHVVEKLVTDGVLIYQRADGGHYVLAFAVNDSAADLVRQLVGQQTIDVETLTERLPRKAKARRNLNRLLRILADFRQMETFKLMDRRYIRALNTVPMMPFERPDGETN